MTLTRTTQRQRRRQHHRRGPDRTQQIYLPHPRHFSPRQHLQLAASVHILTDNDNSGRSKSNMNDNCHLSMHHPSLSATHNSLRQQQTSVPQLPLEPSSHQSIPRVQIKHHYTIEGVVEWVERGLNPYQRRDGTVQDVHQRPRYNRDKHAFPL